jgi:hypothetical protein
MAGIKGARVDYGDQGPVTKTDDKRTGSDPQDSSVPAPVRAGVPVGGSENDNTSSSSKAKPTARPTTGNS